MKKTNIYFLIPCAALLALCSCTKEINEEGFVDKANTISFSAYSNKTRAVTGDVTSDNMKGDNFGVVGYYSNSLYLGATNKAIEQEWKSETSTWEYKNLSDLKFWPNGSMDFYAYFPYSDNATFATANNASGAVMTIPDLECGHDVLFAKHTTTYTERVPLTFHHAFSKIKAVNVKVNGGNVGEANVEVTVKAVEFINTSTNGAVLVDKDGKASYNVATTNVTLKKDFEPSVTISKSLAEGVTLISDTENRYLFATSSTENNNVTGTGKTMWDGKKTSLNGGKLSESDFVCLKLTCKVKDSTHYLVGDESNDGVVYIPLTGSDSNPSTVTELLAGKRYTYNIEFSHNVGFTDEGDPILNPILFSVSSVDGWDDVEVTITL